MTKRSAKPVSSTRPANAGIITFISCTRVWLASWLARVGVKFQQKDNALVECADWKKAQTLGYLGDCFALTSTIRDKSLSH